MFRTVHSCLLPQLRFVTGNSSPTIGRAAMLGPKKPLLPTTVAGLTKGTVSAMKCAVVIAP